MKILQKSFDLIIKKKFFQTYYSFFLLKNPLFCRSSGFPSSPRPAAAAAAEFYSMVQVESQHEAAVAAAAAGEGPHLLRG